MDGERAIGATAIVMNYDGCIVRDTLNDMIIVGVRLDCFFPVVVMYSAPPQRPYYDDYDILIVATYIVMVVSDIILSKKHICLVLAF